MASFLVETKVADFSLVETNSGLGACQGASGAFGGETDFSDRVTPKSFTAFFSGQKSFKNEAVGRQTGFDQGRHKRRRAGQTFDFQTGFQTSTNGHETGIGNGRGAGIGNQAGDFAFGQIPNHFFGDLVLVKTVVRAHRLFDFQVLEQQTGFSGVFGQNKIGFGQNTNSPVGDVFHIPDGSRHDIK